MCASKSKFFGFFNSCYVFFSFGSRNLDTIILLIKWQMKYFLT